VAREALGVARDAIHLFSKKGARFLGAAVAFYALLSAAPLLVVVLRLVGAVFGHERAEDALWQGLGAWIAPEGLAETRALTERLDASTSSGSIVGAALVLYASTRLFRAVRRALNELWGVDLEAVDAARPRALRYGVRYGGAFALTAFLGLMVGSIVVVKAAVTLFATVGHGAPPAVLWAADAASSLVLTFALFLALFRFVPETSVTRKEAVLSAGISAAMFAVGSGLVTAYIRHKQVADLYQGASAVVVAVVWVYYSAQVFFLGACVGATLRERSRRTDPRSVTGPPPAAGAAS
jgi:membrane protein